MLPPPLSPPLVKHADAWPQAGMPTPPYPSLFRFTAEEAIGYIRVCRPGSVIGPQQNFLKDTEEWLRREGDKFRAKGGKFSVVQPGGGTALGGPLQVAGSAAPVPSVGPTPRDAWAAAAAPTSPQQRAAPVSPGRYGSGSAEVDDFISDRDYEEEQVRCGRGWKRPPPTAVATSW